MEFFVAAHRKCLLHFIRKSLLRFRPEILSGNPCGSSGNPCCGSSGNPGGDSSGNPCCGSSGCPLGGWMRLRKTLGFCCILRNAPSGLIRKSLLRFIRKSWWGLIRKSLSRFIRKSLLRLIRLPAGRLDQTPKKAWVLLHFAKCSIRTHPGILVGVHPAARWAAG